MEIPAGEVEFRANYSLFGLGGQALASPFAAVATPGFAAVEKAKGEMDTHLKKLDGYYTQMKFNIANGDSLIQPLQSCLSFLEKTVAISFSRVHPFTSSDPPDMGAGEIAPPTSHLSSDRIQIEVSPTGRSQLHNIFNFIMEKLLVRFPKFHQKKEMGLLVLDILCLIMTLDSDLCPIFPQSFGSCLLFFGSNSEWPNASREVVDRLCYYVLPKCLGAGQEVEFSMAAPIMMVLDGCSSNRDHLLVANTLMQLKRNVCLDMLSVIAYGTSGIREKALDLLLHYWPIPIPEFSQRSNAIYAEWTSPQCENKECRHPKSMANMICLDPLCVAHHKQCFSTKIFILLCPECDNTIHGTPCNRDIHIRLRIPRPLHDVKPNCEFQKICSGKDRQVNRAAVTCYGSSCTAIQHGQPIRMCRDCHNKQHKDLDDPTHIYQVCPPDPWVDESQAFSSVMVEAVSKLLETTPTRKHMPVRPAQQVGYTPSFQIEVSMSREGWWILSHYCTPTNKVRSTQRSWLVHLLALALNWLQVYYGLLREAVMESSEGVAQGGGKLPGSYVVGNVDPRIVDYSRHFANYSDVSNLVAVHALPWLRHVCETNKALVVEVLRPELSESAQVGRLWNESHDKMHRYQWTLGILHTLQLLMQEGKLSDHVFLHLYEQVIPEWMELLYCLRAEPGKMDSLQEPIVNIFSHERHEERMKLFSFVWEYFRTKDPEGMKKALFWLQDLTRLKVPIAYLRHMFEDALKEKCPRKLKKGYILPSTHVSSFDQEAEDTVTRRKESVGSGYDSESALVSQSSLDMGGLISFTSSITRFILMLDIWYCQLTDLHTSTLDSFSLYPLLVKMLRHVWGSNHTPLDHHNPSSNLCFLCHAMELWFGLAIKLALEYSCKRREDSLDEGTDDGGSLLNSRFTSGKSVKLKEKVASTPKKLRKNHSTVELPNIQQKPKVKRVTMEAVELQCIKPLDDSPGTPPSKGGSSDGPRQAPVQRRRFAKVQSYSSLEVVSTFGGMAVGGDSIPSTIKEEEDQKLPPLYEAFQLSLEKFVSKLHPDTSVSMLRWLFTLVHHCKVLDSISNHKRLRSDLKELIRKLWRGLETDSSNVTRSCVGLLLLCADYMVTNLEEVGPEGVWQEGEEEDEEEEEGEGLEEKVTGQEEVEDDGDCVKSKLESKEKIFRDKVSKKEKMKKDKDIFSKLLRDGLTSQNWSLRFKTIEKLASILQFMLSTEVVGVSYHDFHPKLKLTLAHSFCLLTHLLQDRNSNVCTRARYCLTTIKETSLEVTSDFLTLLFRKNPSLRSLVFHTLSLLDSALPELHFLNLELLNRFMNITIQGNSIVSKDVENSSVTASKKLSDSSLMGGTTLLRGSTPKVSTSSSTCPLFEGVADEAAEAAYLSQQVLSLMLRHIGNPRANVRASMEKAQQGCAPSQSKKGSTIKKLLIQPTSNPEEVFVSLLRHNIFDNLKCFPFELRKNLLLEVFLNHIFPVLDHNVRFGQTKGFLTFILQLLCYSAAPNREDFVSSDHEDRPSRQDPQYGLAHLPCHLQAPWLRVCFVILYKYVHECSDSEVSLTRWCMVIALNSLRSPAHDCSTLNSASGQPAKPTLQRQGTIESFGSDGGVGNIPGSPQVEAGPVRYSLSVPGGVGAGLREKGGGALTPVPEDLEGSLQDSGEDGEDRERVKTDAVGGAQRESKKHGGASKRLSSTTKDSTSFVPLLQGRCAVCGKPTNELSEEVVALCTVVVGTFCNRLPHLVPRYLVGQIIPAVAKVVISGHFSWQTDDCLNSPVPGSASSVARHILVSVLAQFGERRLFLYVFSHNHGKLRTTVFRAIVHSLEDGKLESLADQSGVGVAGGGVGVGGGGGGGGDKDGELSLYRSSPVKYFLQDVQTSQDLSRHTLINLAAYLASLSEAMPSPVLGSEESPVQLMRDLGLWEFFFRRLRTHSEILRDQRAVASLFRVLVILFQYTIDYPVTSHSGSVYLSSNVYQPLTQSLISLVEAALRSVYCPLGGLVMLGGMWYRVFQNNQREAEKLVKMLISELRKALKARTSSAELIRPDNFLVLIQLLMLEENGYLGYVDGLEDMKLFAPELKERYETHCLSVIQCSQWDFTDALQFFSTPLQSWTQELIPQLKLSLAQWLALRVQHSREPVERLRRMINGDFKALLSSNSKSSSGGVQWQTSQQCLHILAWLLLGALTHNTIHSVAANVRSMASSGGTCYPLKALLPRETTLMERVLSLTRISLQALVSGAEQDRSDKLEVTFMFTTIFTVYVELYMPKSGPLILEFWEKVCGCLYHQLVSNELQTTFCDEVVRSLDDHVVSTMKMLGLACYPLLLPLWQQLADQALPNRKLIFAQMNQDSTLPLSCWFDKVIRELVRIEMESLQT